jgi:lipopolysaccharide biosynthesis glycosyltransferase
MSFRIYIGWDSREDIAYQVAKHSILRRSSSDIGVYSLKLSPLRELGMITRENDARASTEFTFTRFLVPYLNQYRGWAVFIDCDFLFLSDARELFVLADTTKAVQVVQHDYTPKPGMKMDGQTQHIYPRKNWSSCILFNCAHPSNRVLDLDMVNREEPGFLHQFKWLRDDEIGELPYQWNYLEGTYDTNDAKAVHYTLGGPWFPNCQDVDYAQEWCDERDDYLRTAS